MTAIELAEKELRKQKLSLKRALARPNVPQSEIDHIRHLCDLRQEIWDALNERNKS